MYLAIQRMACRINVQSLFAAKPDRGGIGMEEVKKRKAEEELEHYRQKVRAKQQNETKSLEDFR